MNRERVRELEAALAGAAGARTVRLEGPISVRKYSTVYRAHLDGGAHEQLAVKCCTMLMGTDPDAAAARAQFDSLARACRRMRGLASPLGVPEPAFLLESQGAYAMAWLSGQSVSDCLKGGDPQAAMAACARAGRWLGAFHRAGPLRSGRAELAGKTGDVRRMLEGSAGKGPFGAALAAAARRSAAVVEQPVQVSWVHGDAKPDNVWLCTAETYGIDINLVFENSVEHDLAQFLNNLDLLLMGRRFRAMRTHSHALREAVLAGYAATGPQRSQLALDWLRLWGALSMWSSRASAWRGIAQWVERRAMAALAACVWRDVGQRLA
jgi:tRNA A-37 threonylcarbamoyl transferase component Bud32